MNENGKDTLAVWFGLRVAMARNAQHWTQRDLAERMTDAGYPLHHSTIAKLEGGTRPTPITEAMVLARVLGVSLASLAGGEDVEREVSRIQLRSDIAAMERAIRDAKANLFDLQGKLSDLRRQQLLMLDEDIDALRED
jgi:transcriptional regulator with XRE-family HTH domain